MYTAYSVAINTSSNSILISMARGNQRDLARARNLKKQQEQGKAKKGDPAKRMESDADKMRRKQAEGMFN